MDFELGIVCARCDRYAPMGTATCVECGNVLAIFTHGAPVEPAPHPPSAPIPILKLPQAEHPQPVRHAIPSVPPSSRLAAPPRPAPHAPAPAPPASADSTQRMAPILHAPIAEASEPAAAVAYSDHAPPSSLLGHQQLVPRRGGGLGNVRTALATGPETAVSSQSSVPPLLAAASPPPTAESDAPPDLKSLAAAADLTLEELMEQARHFVCRSCSTPVPIGHKFCGRCGAAIPPEILGARTQFFGQLQAPGKAKLILIRGEGVEGLSYQLNAEQHVVGRNGQLVFPDDPFVSPKHANLFYRNGKLVVRDEGSYNGVFVRVHGTIEIQLGDEILAGEQLFKIDANPKQNDGPAPDGTYFYSSPKHQTFFRITQILQGGIPAMVVCARGQSLQIGREGADLNFPGDLYMSGSHCKIEEASGKYALTDLNSRNGTYIRLRSERELAHGDYIFIGRKLLRVEITAA
jgi:pSer/pThr/pTyr-binding forkhead associated (FHA) protein